MNKEQLQDAVTAVSRLALEAGAEPEGLYRAVEMAVFEAERLKYSPPVARVLERIETGFAGELTSASLARDAFVSASYLHKLFKRETGISLMAYVTRFRLQKSLNMLRSTRRPVTGVAHLCGFPDLSYYSRLFKREFGVVPTEWRKNDAEN
jgi:AraC-like DNA-binding protein